AESGRMVRMSTESREAFLQFAAHPESRWPANFRDLTAAVNRMATLARGGRISSQDVAEEISRLKTLWQHVPSVAAESSDLNSLLGVQAAENLDLFDRVQLEAVVRICRQCRSLSDAGRVLFAHSRQQRSTTNDADRLRKYLARFGLTWQTVVETPSNGNL
ncbi:MAG: hypothetical protein KDA96_10760, partial [Planctomycetaceae bacterium]|nr:hypothetical protein [Planctomycetaceae bacterium]